MKTIFSIRVCKLRRISLVGRRQIKTHGRTIVSVSATANCGDVAKGVRSDTAIKQLEASDDYRVACARLESEIDVKEKDILQYYIAKHNIECMTEDQLRWFACESLDITFRELMPDKTACDRIELGLARQDAPSDPRVVLHKQLFNKFDAAPRKGIKPKDERQASEVVKKIDHLCGILSGMLGATVVPELSIHPTNRMLHPMNMVHQMNVAKQVREETRQEYDQEYGGDR